jgi:hypothetical protein
LIVENVQDLKPEVRPAGIRMSENSMGCAGAHGIVQVGDGGENVAVALVPYQATFAL